MNIAKKMKSYCSIYGNGHKRKSWQCAETSCWSKNKRHGRCSFIFLQQTQSMFPSSLCFNSTKSLLKVLFALCRVFDATCNSVETLEKHGFSSRMPPTRWILWDCFNISLFFILLSWEKRALHPAVSLLLLLWHVRVAVRHLPAMPTVWLKSSKRLKQTSVFSWDP